MNRIKIYLHNRKSSESRNIVLEVYNCIDIDEYIRKWIDEQVKSSLSDNFFDNCHTSDITYSWSLALI